MAEEEKETMTSSCGVRSFRSGVMRRAWQKTKGEDISFKEFGRLISESYKEMRKECGM